MAPDPQSARTRRGQAKRRRTTVDLTAAAGNEKSDKEGGGKKVKGKGAKSQAAKDDEQIIAMVDDTEFDSESKLDDDFDVETDLNDQFFTHGYKVVQGLMMESKIHEAGSCKKYLDIIKRLKVRYLDELSENNRLRPEVEQAYQKLRYAIELILGSEKKFDLLRDSLAEAWMNSDASKLREQITATKMEALHQRCASYESKQVKEYDDSQDFGYLAKYKNMILRERDRLNIEVIDLEKRLQLHRTYSESVEYLNQMMQENIEKLETRDRKLERSKFNLAAKLAALQNSFEEQRYALIRTQKKFDFLQSQYDVQSEDLAARRAECDKQKTIIERFNSENMSQLMTINKMEQDLNSKDNFIRQLEQAMKVQKEELKKKQTDLTTVIRRDLSTKRMQNATVAKLRKLIRIKEGQRHEINALANKVEGLERNLQAAGYHYDELRRERDNLYRERDQLRNTQQRLTDVINENRHVNLKYLSDIDGLRTDLNRMNVRLDEAKIHRMKYEKERNDLIVELAMLNSKAQDDDEEIQRSHELVTALTEDVQKERDTIIMLRKNLEATHVEKMGLRRELYNVTQDRDSNSRIVMKLQHQNQQLASEISQHMEKVKNMRSNYEHVLNDKKMVQNQLRMRENLLSSLRRDLKRMKIENENLAKTISDDERKFFKMSITLDDMTKQRNLVGLQMVRRNDEIVLLRERISTMENTLTITEVKYNQHLEDIRLLKSEIVNLRTERECLQRALQSTPDMRQEIIRLQRQLNQERVKLRAYIEDCKTPCGIHRWRILKGVDPSKYALIQKMQRLQRRNLRIDVEKTNVQKKLRESETLCASLKHLLENLPIAQLRDSVVTTQRINRRQQRRLKALSAELAIDEIELRERDIIIHNFKDRLVRSERERLSNAHKVPFTTHSVRAPSQSLEDIAEDSKTNILTTGIFALNETALNSLREFQHITAEMAAKAKPIMA